MKKYLLVAGIDGVGRTTLSRRDETMEMMLRIDLDEIVSGFGDWKNPSDVEIASDLARRTTDYFFSENASFYQKTTLFDGNVMRNIRKAQSLGYRIEIHYIGVESINLVRERIANRLSRGEHGTRDHNLSYSYEKSLSRLEQLIPECDLCVMYDNTEKMRPFARYENKTWQFEPYDLPGWFMEWKGIVPMAIAQ